MSLEDEIHEEALYDVSCVVTVHAQHPEWAVDSARRTLGTGGMGRTYVPRRRYEGPLNEDQQRAVARYCLSPERAKAILEDCPGFPEEMFGGLDKAREAVAGFIEHLRREEIGT
jgi:hypothetical protein